VQASRYRFMGNVPAPGLLQGYFDILLFVVVGSSNCAWTASLPDLLQYSASWQLESAAGFTAERPGARCGHKRGSET
jgi:hypothetical protein